MRRVVLVFACALLVAGNAGAQGFSLWGEETRFVRILDPVDGSSVNPKVPFLTEVVLTGDVMDEAAGCSVDTRQSAFECGISAIPFIAGVQWHETL